MRFGGRCGGVWWRWCRRGLRRLFDCCWFVDPAIQLKLTDADQVQEPPGMFACAGCHDVQYFSTVEKGFWNKLIFCLTGGMLYGREVKRPAELKEERRRVRVRRIHGGAPVREKVLARLRNGWSDFAIAKELGKSINAVRCQVRLILRGEGVADRQALAEKLEFAKSPPLNQEERAGARRFAVKEMLLLNCSHREMMEKICVGRDVLKYDIRMIYRMYGVKGFGHKARRALAEKMGVGVVTKGEESA